MIFYYVILNLLNSESVHNHFHVGIFTSNIHQYEHNPKIILLADFNLNGWLQFKTQTHVV